MLYYTQIVFVKEGQEAVFHAFEDQVLPLLERHKGTLLYRVRPDTASVLTTTLGHPYEIHLVSFPDRTDFESYRDDPERRQHITLKDTSVERILLVEGRRL
ncbi:DUF1330 domain-containing protein [Spirosoma fluviale]|uniref:DUF1330 domain-containing protein n=1 Tax=Spirosoma fluviale TaxID=1597977 RepID=A0A286F4Z3_9BACT|nr:DUF1330 domain-containing protein [Spirosoma fluviale]SOD78186.1 hypothetical protein SAMN06269250_0336 [Spirosoma fluviale]